MIFLLNPERVFTEVLIGLKRVIAERLEIPEVWVVVQLRRVDETFVPEVTLETPLVGEVVADAVGSTFFSLTAEQVQMGVEKLIEQAMLEIKLGLAGLMT